jgi:hypothetical protein
MMYHDVNLQSSASLLSLCHSFAHTVLSLYVSLTPDTVAFKETASPRCLVLSFLTMTAVALPVKPLLSSVVAHL